MSVPEQNCRIVRVPQILGGEPVIQGTRTPVRAIVESVRVGIAPEQIPVGLPHLTVGEVFAALRFYDEHREEIDGYMDQNRIPEEWLDSVAEPMVTAALTDEEVLVETELRMTSVQDARLSELLHRQQAGPLTESERTELTGLMIVYQRLLLRKAVALREAVERDLREPLSSD